MAKPWYESDYGRKYWLRRAFLKPALWRLCRDEMNKRWEAVETLRCHVPGSRGIFLSKTECKRKRLFYSVHESRYYITVRTRWNGL